MYTSELAERGVSGEWEQKSFVPSVSTGKYTLLSGMVALAPKWVRLAPNGTNPGLFQIRFQCISRFGGKPRPVNIMAKSPNYAESQ